MLRPILSVVWQRMSQTLKKDKKKAKKPQLKRKERQRLSFLFSNLKPRIAKKSFLAFAKLPFFLKASQDLLALKPSQGLLFLESSQSSFFDMLSLKVSLTGLVSVACFLWKEASAKQDKSFSVSCQNFILFDMILNYNLHRPS